MQAEACFDQECGQALFSLYFTETCCPLRYSKFCLVDRVSIEYANCCGTRNIIHRWMRLQFNECFDKYFSPHSGLPLHFR